MIQFETYIYIYGMGPQPSYNRIQTRIMRKIKIAYLLWARNMIRTIVIRPNLNSSERIYTVIFNVYACIRTLSK